MATNERSSDVGDRIRTFLKRNFPQIQMHGGDATVVNCDATAGTASIRLTGACSGCGISPMTIQAIRSRLPDEIAEIDEVRVETGTPDDPTDTEPGDGHEAMGGHPAGGGVSPDYEGEIPDWRKDE